jgi:hypothetical protein
MDRVIPNLEHVPKRVYMCEDGVITCREYISHTTEYFKTKVETGKVLFVLALSLEKAEMLMQDLYYGEYTGG